MNKRIEVHPVTLEHKHDEGKLIVTCAVCGYHVEILNHTGAKEIKKRGNPWAAHRGGAMQISTGVEQDNTPRTIH